jgi:hypothetical protein
VDGPWKFEDANHAYVLVAADRAASAWFPVVPGPAPATPGSGDTGQGGDQVFGGSTRGALAKTGASVLGLAFLGALLVAAGAALRRWPVSR